MSKSKDVDSSSKYGNFDLLLSKLELDIDHDKRSTLEELAMLSTDLSLSKEQFLRLMDILFDLKNGISIIDKRYIIHNLFYGKISFKFPKSIIWRILSTIGMPQVYYEDGKQKILKRLALSLQVDLLEWFYELICSGGIEKESLVSVLPVLFRILAYEYPRAVIVKIIIVILSQGKITYNTFLSIQKIQELNLFKPWQLEIAVELIYKFPTDKNLKKLLIFMKSLNPNVDFQRYAKNNIYNLNNLGSISRTMLENSQSLPYSDEPNMKDQVIIHRNVFLNDSYAFEGSTKKRKVDPFGTFDLDCLGLKGDSELNGYISIHEIRSLKKLIENFENIGFLNMASILRGDPWFDKSIHIRLMFLLIASLGRGKMKSNLEVIKRFKYFITLSVKDAESMPQRSVPSFLNKLRRILSITYGVITFDDAFQYLLESIRSSRRESLSIAVLQGKLDFIYFLPLNQAKSAIKPLRFSIDVFVIPQSEDKNNEVDQVYYIIQKIADIFSFWWTQAEDLDSGSDVISDICFCFNEILPYLYERLSEKIHLGSIKIEALILILLRFIRCLRHDVIDKFMRPQAIVLPPILFYSLLLSKSPIVISELCGFLYFSKSNKFTEIENGHKYKALQNTYLMDTLNLLWRDKGFHYDTNPKAYSKAMFLNPEFVDTLLKLDIFNFSDSLKLETVGNLFHNPSWSYITTQIIRDLEDSTENVNTRHPGPVSAASIVRLTNDSDVRWLSNSYEELKIIVLNSLDKLGFVGFADLIFSSVKSLKDRRELEIR